MPNIYRPIDPQLLVRPQQPNLVDQAISVWQQTQDRAIKRQQMERESRLYDLKLQEGEMGLQEKAAQLVKTKKSQEAEDYLDKKFADLQRLGTDMPTTLGLMRSEAARFGPEMSMKYDTYLDNALGKAVAAKNVKQIALIHNARNPGDVLAAQDAGARYLQPKRIELGKGQRSVALDPISGMPMAGSEISGPEEDQDPRVMAASRDLGKRAEGLAILRSISEATREPRSDGGGGGEILPGRTAKDAINLQNLGKQNEAITAQHDRKMEFWVRAARDSGMELDQQYEWVMRKMNADPSVRRGRQQIIDNVKMANAINAKAGIVETPLPDFGADEQTDATGGSSDLDNFLMGVGVRNPRGPAVPGAITAPGQAEPLAPVYNPGMGTAPYQFADPAGGSQQGLRGVLPQQRLADPANLQRIHAVLQEQALARLEANPALFMSYVQSSDPDLQEAAKAFQQRVMRSR